MNNPVVADLIRQSQPTIKQYEYLCLRLKMERRNKNGTEVGRTIRTILYVGSIGY